MDEPLAQDLVRLFGEPGLIDAEGAPGPIAPGRQLFETATLDFEKSTGLGEGHRKPGLRNPRQLGRKARFDIPGLPGAFHEKTEKAAIAGLPVPSGGKPCRAPGGPIDHRLDHGFMPALPFAFLIVGKAQGALTGHVPLQEPFCIPPVALGEKAEARRDIVLETGTPVLVTIEKRNDALAVVAQGIGRLIDIVEAKASGLGVQDLGQLREKCLFPLLALFPFPPV